MNTKVIAYTGLGLAAGLLAVFIFDRTTFSNPKKNIPSSSSSSPVEQETVSNNVPTAAGALNNPGNIRKSSTTYIGEIESPSSVLKSFEKMSDGYRAMIELLKHYYSSNFTTIREIISHYAPPGDGNDTEAYISFVSSQLNISADSDLHDVINSESVTGLVAAMTKQEQGADFYINESDLTQAYQLS